MKDNFLILLLFLIFNSVEVYSQNSTIYLFKDRYSDSTQQVIETSSLDFKEIKILVNYMIDPKKEGVVDYNRVKYWLDKFYPDKSSDGVLCIDLENELYNKLKGNILTRYKEVSDYEYELAEAEYIKLVQFIKNDLPNLKVGYYGMPFRAYKIEELRDNASEKLDPILKNVDVLFPSMYIPFPATVTGTESNYDFLERHLNSTFGYASRLNKPVTPFFWYLTLSPDKDYSNEMIPKDELFQYIDFMENYRSSNNDKISGFIWWDTPSTYSYNRIKLNYLKEIKNKDLSIDNVFHYYFKLE